MDKSAEVPVADWLADCVSRFDGPVNEVEPGKPIPIYRNYEVAPPLEDLNLVDLAAKLSPDQNEFIRRVMIELLSIDLK